MTNAMAAPVARAPLFLITRPQADDADAFAVRVRDAGFAPVSAPLLQIEPRAPANVRNVAAVAFTSSNGVRAAGLPPPDWSGETYVVGATTGDAARKAGWPNVSAAAGDVAALAALIADRRRRATDARPVLHVAGAHRKGELVAMLESAGVPATRVVAYEAVAAARLPAEAVASLDNPDDRAWVSFFSPRTAEIFLRLARAEGRWGALSSLGAACLSDAVADVAKAAPWRQTAVASRPDAAALLEAVRAAPA